MNRRHALKIIGFGFPAASCIGAAGTAALTFRWHNAPRRQPFLTDAHLATLAPPDGVAPRVLFIGNSYTLNHDVPARVAAVAEDDGQEISTAMAAAHGARLIQTRRIEALNTVLRDGNWQALVLQDFSDTPLRVTDRWGSALAMADLARRAGSPPVVLYPTFALPPGHPVYRKDNSRLRPAPSDRADFAARIIDFYDEVAREHGWVRAPVTEALFDGIDTWIADDGHHLNARGAGRVAEVLWGALSNVL